MIIPGQRLGSAIESCYPQVGNSRRPYPLAAMLRIHLFQSWCNLSDPVMEDAFYEIASMRLFARLSLVHSFETTIANIHDLTQAAHLIAW